MIHAHRGEHPYRKNIGDPIIGASINKNGHINTGPQSGQDAVLSQIIKLVEDAPRLKAPLPSLPM